MVGPRVTWEKAQVGLAQRAAGAQGVKVLFVPVLGTARGTEQVLTSFVE